jgi:hypothetical protein
MSNPRNKTLGQIAYEAYYPASLLEGATFGWDLGFVDHEKWEAVAQGVLVECARREAEVALKEPTPHA